MLSFGADSAARFEHEVERRFGSAPHAREAAGGDHLAQPQLAGLRAEAETDLLRQRARGADHRRAGVVDAAHRVEVVAAAGRARTARRSSSCRRASSASRTCAAAPTGSPRSCRQSKNATRSKRPSKLFASATSKRVFAATPSRRPPRARSRSTARDSRSRRSASSGMRAPSRSSRCRGRSRRRRRWRRAAASRPRRRARAATTRRGWRCSPGGRSARCRGTGIGCGRASRTPRRCGSFRDLRLVEPEARQHLERAGHRGRAVLVGEHARLLRIEEEEVGRVVVLDVAGRRLRASHSRT